ncbi:MAG: hypothetical protein ABI557_11495, partial [Aureliella sp.]
MSSLEETNSNADNAPAAVIPTQAVATRRGWLTLLILFCVGGLSAGVARSYLFSKPSAAVSGQDGIFE